MRERAYLSQKQAFPDELYGPKNTQKKEKENTKPDPGDEDSKNTKENTKPHTRKHTQKALLSHTVANNTRKTTNT